MVILANFPFFRIREEPTLRTLKILFKHLQGCWRETTEVLFQDSFIFGAATSSHFFKGYLRYKTITSQNVPPIAQIKIFLFRTKIMFCSQDIQVFVFLTLPWFTKSVTSRWVLVHERRCIFEYIFWTTNHEVTKLGQLIDISKDNNFQ